MHTVFALLCFVVVIHWLIFPYPSGLLYWHWGNLTIAPVPAKQPWWIWINTSCELIMNDCITTTKQSTTKPCAYFLGYTVDVDFIPGHIHGWSCKKNSYFTTHLLDLSTVSSTLLVVFSKTKTRLTHCPFRGLDIILVISKLISVTDILWNCPTDKCDLSDDKSILVQVMVWCRHTSSHYLNQCRSVAPYDVTRPQWVKGYAHTLKNVYILCVGF